MNLKIPTHTTVLNWTKKQGISQFREKSFYQQEKWVLILDESIQFGNKKLLLVLAVPENRCNKSKALAYKDLTPLVLKVSHSWKSEDIVQGIREHIDFEQISYCISDTGNNLTSAIKSLDCKHIADVNHKFSLIIKQVFEDSTLFNNYVKALSLLRAQKSMSRTARIVPPNQRVMNRFMNLTPLFEWGIKMLSLLDSHQLTGEEASTLSFLEEYRNFIFDSYQILLRLNSIQKTLKNKGFSNASAKEVNSVFSGMESDNSLKIRNEVDRYIADLTVKSEGKTVCCSSDIIESFFGKYKEIVNGNKSVGISDLSLCIAAMTGNCNPDKNKTGKNMEAVSMKKVREWKTKNIAKTLFAEKIELNKKIDRNYFTKM